MGTVPSSRVRARGCGALPPRAALTRPYLATAWLGRGAGGWEGRRGDPAPVSTRPM